MQRSIFLFNGRTCIHAAAARGRVEDLRTLLTWPGGKELLNMKDKDGKTALGLLRRSSVSDRDTDAEGLLLGFGANC